MRERELTMGERMVWGECPACGAEDEESCYADVGVQLGVRCDGRRLRDGEGAHIGRLQLAPVRVKLVSADS